MATLTATCTLAGSGLTSSTLSITKNPGVEILGDVQIRRVTCGTNTVQILEADDWNNSGSMVWLHNPHASESITIGEDSDGGATLDQVWMALLPGEWAFFPWDTTVDLHADASGACQLEVGIFERAAS